MWWSPGPVVWPSDYLIFVMVYFQCMCWCWCRLSLSYYMLSLMVTWFGLSVGVIPEFIMCCSSCDNILVHFYCAILGNVIFQKCTNYVRDMRICCLKGDLQG